MSLAWHVISSATSATGCAAAQSNALMSYATVTVWFFSKQLDSRTKWCLITSERWKMATPAYPQVNNGYIEKEYGARLTCPDTCSWAPYMHRSPTILWHRPSMLSSAVRVWANLASSVRVCAFVWWDMNCSMHIRCMSRSSSPRSTFFFEKSFKIRACVENWKKQSRTLKRRSAFPANMRVYVRCTYVWVCVCVCVCGVWLFIRT